MRRSFTSVMILVCAIGTTTACQDDNQAPVDRTPLPTTAAPPYICDHIPLNAVKLMTGVQDPLVRGHFGFTSSGRGIGSCAIYQRDGERFKVLLIKLTAGSREEAEEEIRYGTSPLPIIVPGAIGYYFKPKGSENNSAYAHLVRGKTWLAVQLDIGVAGRDNTADVVAMMKLIAPKLLTDASAPLTSPSAKISSPSPAKD